MNYIEYTFELDPILPAREVLLAELSELGFESFVESETGLQAYIQKDLIPENLIENLITPSLDDLKFSYSIKEIEQVNWNEEWEKNFEPIIVDDICLIKAPFHHLKTDDYKWVIEIEPKMSFGTGHHSTTHLIISEMLGMDWEGRSVLDMGSGTAVLAILASMKGAIHCTAIDIDEWAFENGVENGKRNNVGNIDFLKGGAELLDKQQYDLILANINRNILMTDMDRYVSVLKPGGEILFSGFYDQDVPDLTERAKELGLELISKKLRNEWCMLRMKKRKKKGSERSLF